MKISNRPTQVTNDKFNFYSFVSAREAFKHILSLPENAGKVIVKGLGFLIRSEKQKQITNFIKWTLV
jgi:hypothetical protein